MRGNAALSDAWVGQFVDPRSLRWILVAALALFFLDLALVLSGALDGIDHDTLVWVDGLRSASGDRGFQFITDTGTGYRRAAVLVLATVFFAVIRQRGTAVVYLAMGVPVIHCLLHQIVRTTRTSPVPECRKPTN